MNSKKYVIGFLLLVGIFFWGNVALWYGFTKSCFVADGQDRHGDLTRMAFLPSGESKTASIKYNNSHIEFTDYLRSEDNPAIDMLTIGDSFSNGGGGNYYQDYIADRYGKNVLNISMMEDGNPFTVLRRLLDSGLMDELNPQVVVLESVERAAGKRFAAKKVAKIMPEKELIKYYSVRKANGALDFTGILPGGMLNANCQMVMAKMKNNGDEKRLSPDVYKESLTEALFTDKEREKMLLFYHEDLWWQDAEVDFPKIEKNLSEVAAELRKRNIQLVVMINVDKLDLYQPYIASEERTAENTFMEDFSQHVNGYVYINTKEILRGMLAEGEKDVYWQDDTHWSWKAQQRVVDYMMEKVKFINL